MPAWSSDFVDGLVGVEVLGVLPHHGNADLMFRIAQAVQQVAPVVQVQRSGGQLQSLDDQLIELVLDQAQRHFVDREVLVLLFDDGIERHVAEEGDFLAIFARNRSLGAADQHVGLNTDFPQAAHGVLRRFRLQFAGGLEIRDERQVDVEAVLFADVQARTGEWPPETAGSRCRRPCRRFP